MTYINPLNYDITIEPNLEEFTFKGTVHIQLEIEDEVDTIELNALELTIVTCSLNSGGQKQPCRFQTDPSKELLCIFLPASIKGALELTIVYTGSINDKMAGFYRSYYTADGKKKPLAVTQFQESDARRAFPCLDHPRYKATYEIRLIIDAALTAISNQVIDKSEILPGDKRRITFAKTPKMSTYLVFWAVGSFDFQNDDADPRARIAFLPGMEPYTAFGLDFGKKALHFCEDYYDIPYPLSKVDFIAIPDFAFGAMENWGAITFRENLLLYYPGITSKAGEERIAEVIAHEMAHQWFGNLVTPEDWKFLWLNESFATYFGFGVVDHYHPEWDTWSQFLYSQTGSALARDGHLETIPIEIPGGDHVVINTSTAPIIYCKGGSILRQIKGYIGDAGFKKGVRQYLRRHAYRCAASRDLWQAFETASNKPVTQMIQSWIEQPGYPLVTAERQGQTLRLRQQRFSYLPAPSDQIWQIPVNISILNSSGQWRRLDILMDNQSVDVDLGKDAKTYKLNINQTGFFRVKYNDSPNLSQLGRAIADKTLSAEDRWGIQSDLYALVECGASTISDYLDFLGHFAEETAYLPLIGIAENLLHAYLVLPDDYKNRIAEAGRQIIENTLSTIGKQPQSDEAHTISILRDRLIWQAVFWNSPSINEWAQTEFQKLQKGATCHPDIIKSILQAGAAAGDLNTFNWLIKRLESTTSEHDRTNILQALGCFRDQACINKTLSYVLTSVPARNQSIPISALSANPEAIPGLWDWYRAEQKAFEAFHPLIHERVIASIVPMSALERGEKQEAVKHFCETNPAHINHDVIRLILEKLEINCRIRKAHTIVANNAREDNP